MPRYGRRRFRFKKRRSRRRSRPFRRSRRGNKRSSVSRLKYLIPDRLFVKLRYRQRITLASTTGATAFNIFRGNSPYDADESGTGAQPPGFDNYAAMYERYRVMGSKIAVTFCSVQTTAPTQTYEVGILARPDNTAPATMDAVAGNPYASLGLLTPGNGKVRKKMYMSTAKILGLTKQAVKANENLSSAVTTNPATTWEWFVYSQPADRASTATSIAFVCITYYVEFYKREYFDMS